MTVFPMWHCKFIDWKSAWLLEITSKNKWGSWNNDYVLRWPITVVRFCLRAKRNKKTLFFCLVLGTLQPAQAQATLIYDSRDTKSRITQADKNSESKWVGNERRAGQPLNWIKRRLTKKKKKKVTLTWPIMARLGCLPSNSSKICLLHGYSGRKPKIHSYTPLNGSCLFFWMTNFKI